MKFPSKNASVARLHCPINKYVDGVNININAQIKQKIVDCDKIVEEQKESRGTLGEKDSSMRASILDGTSPWTGGYDLSVF